jgi:hypothetical protein
MHGHAHLTQLTLFRQKKKEAASSALAHFPRPARGFRAHQAAAYVESPGGARTRQPVGHAPGRAFCRRAGRE